MSERPDIEAKSPFSVLRRFARQAARNAEERCDLCGESIGPVHQHLLHISTREMSCVCRACALLFDRAEAGAGLRRLIPTRSLSLVDFDITEAEWESLRVPVNIVFFSYHTDAQRVVALYPGPMGVAESLLTFETWQDLERRNPMLKRMEPDVEALLVNRVRNARDYFLVPIDACYRLVGLIRVHWKGLGGGSEVWKEIDQFFTDLKARARPVGSPHA